MTDTKSRSGPTSLAAAIGKSIPAEETAGIFASPGMTDEWWDRRDQELADRRAAEKAKAQREEEVKRYGELASRGFPERAIDFAKSASENTAAMRRVASWDPEVDSILVLSGSPGCGKTVAATWWAAKRSSPPRFVRATTFAASSRYDRDTRDEWFGSRALVLDDLGTEYLDAKGSFLVDLDELLDVFYGDRKPLLITTNCTKDAFKERYGSRVVDRLRESGSWFSISEPSMRKRTDGK
jgi:DNA replication protein DnaC